jgi:rhodanese-related sulfurtransferase
VKARFSFLALTFALLVAACGASTTAAPVELVTAEEAAATITQTPDVIVLDIRTPEEFAGGHLEEAINIDFYASDFPDKLSQLDRNASYVMYCRSGSRSEQAASMMRQLEFTSVEEIDGGILSWTAAGLPIIVP